MASSELHDDDDPRQDSGADADDVTRLVGNEEQTADAHDAETERIAERVRSLLFAAEPEPSRIGRYVVLESIGRGGMANVVAAYDERLDRKVAIKVLLEDGIPTEGDRARLLREAQALARLSHPNIVAVHEVGEHDGELFLAMEFVRGQSLAKWFESKPAWPEVLETFVQAGRGLAAAHRADLVHRDFKPHNVMRGDDGTVKVLDFGLAYASIEPSDEPSPTMSASTLSMSLTVPGTVMGTPAYMSPEQHRGELADARADQYGYCLSLWEGLTGSRPFQSKALEPMIRAKHASPPSWPSPAPSVPRSIVDAIRRGLSPDPEDRWPSMEPLLEALSWDPSRRRNRWLWGTAGLVTLGLVSVALPLGAQERVEPCTGAREELAGAWDETRRAEARATMVGLDEPYVASVWERTEQALDAYADDWVTMATEACEATTVRGEQSPRMLDLRMGCLQRAAVDLRTTVDTLAAADATVVEQAHELVGGLRPLSRCADVEALSAQIEPPLPDEAEAVADVRLELSRASSLQRAGRYDAARAATQAARAKLDGIRYEPLRTEVVLREGLVLQSLGDYEAAETTLVQALALASGHQQHDAMATAAIGLIYDVAYQQRREEGLRYWPLAKGLTRDRPRLEALARNNRALALGTLGRHDDAEAEHRAVLELRERALGPDHPDVASSRSNLAIAIALQGRFDEAESELRRALEIREQALGVAHPETLSLSSNLASTLAQGGKLSEAESLLRTTIERGKEALGPMHPKLVIPRGTLATVLSAQGKLSEAEAEIRVSLALTRQALGPDHPDVAVARFNLGAILEDQGRFAEAETEIRAATAMWTERLGPEHPDVALGRSSLASVLEQQGKHEEAEAELRQAIALRRSALGPDHPALATSLHNLGVILHDQQRLDEAETELRAALEIREEALAADHPDVTETRARLASLLLDDGRAAEARPLAEQAWIRRQGSEVRASDRARSAFVLALILWTTEGQDRDRDRDRARARRLVEEATAALEEDPDEDRQLAERLRQWTDEHLPR